MYSLSKKFSVILIVEGFEIKMQSIQKLSKKAINSIFAKRAPNFFNSISNESYHLASFTVIRVYINQILIQLNSYK